MAKSLKNVVSILLLLFLAPIIIATVQTPLFPVQKQQSETKEVIPKEESNAVVYAAQLETKTNVSEILEAKKAFVYFTHSQEAYKPILAAKGEKIATYHPENNITSFQEQITAQFALHQLEADILGPESTGDAKQYNSIRPFVQEAIGQKEYDIILDIHRDSAKANVTTLKSGEESYAKFIFVIGREHPNYRWNEQLAQNLSNQLNKLVPGISRGILPKEGKGVDGVYNQDLSANLLNVELGGIENNEQELNRSIAVLAKALSNMLNEQELPL